MRKKDELSKEHTCMYLGGGIWVCFACWATLLIGGRRR